MPAALDPVMAWALRRAGIPFAVIVHDADKHPGDGLPLQMLLQRHVVRQADALVALTAMSRPGWRSRGWRAARSW